MILDHQQTKHLQHVGWDNDTGLDMKNIRPSLQQFFEKAGISKERLKDASTRTFIYDFLERNWFQEEIKKLEDSSSPGTPLTPSQRPVFPLPCTSPPGTPLIAPQRPAPPVPITSPPVTPPTPLPRHKKEDIYIAKSWLFVD